jgi:predicted DsbA family dithiol-disulfide isomerase
MESPHVTADVIEVQEYPDLAARYGVMGVPKTVINDRVQFTGAVPEEGLLAHVLRSVGNQEADDEGPPQVSDQTTPIA